MCRRHLGILGKCRVGLSRCGKGSEILAFQLSSGAAGPGNTLYPKDRWLRHRGRDTWILCKIVWAVGILMSPRGLWLILNSVGPKKWTHYILGLPFILIGQPCCKTTIYCHVQNHSRRFPGTAQLCSDSVSYLMSWVKFSITMSYWLENNIIYVRILQLNPVQVIVLFETILWILTDLSNRILGSLPYVTYTLMSPINIKLKMFYLFICFYHALGNNKKWKVRNFSIKFAFHGLNPAAHIISHYGFWFKNHIHCISSLKPSE